MTDSIATQPRIALAVQCEGNGHYTQAIGIAHSLAEHLGWQITCVVLNARKRASVPAHFLATFVDVPTLYVDGPVMVRDAQNSTLDKVGMVLNNLRDAGHFWGSLQVMHEFFQLHRIDTIINLFDGLIVWYMQHFRLQPLVCLNVATQFKLYVPFRASYKHSKRIRVAQQHDMITDLQAAQAFVVLDAFVRLHTIPLLPELPSPTLTVGTNSRTLLHIPPAAATSVPGVSVGRRTHTYTVALCPFPPDRTAHTPLPSGHPATWFVPSPTVEHGSLLVTPCFVSHQELLTQITPADQIKLSNPLYAELNSVSPGTIRITGYVNVPSFLNQIIAYCTRVGQATKTSTSQQHALHPLDFVQQFLRVVAPHPTQVVASMPSFHLYLFRAQERPVERLLPNLTCFALNRANFLTCMSACDGFLTTAGVESVCEAVCLEKPILIVPGPSDEEQYMNALIFAQNLEGVLARSDFCLDDLLVYITRHRNTRGISSTYASECSQVRAWLDTSSYAFAQLLKQTLSLSTEK